MTHRHYAPVQTKNCKFQLLFGQPTDFRFYKPNLIHDGYENLPVGLLFALIFLQGYSAFICPGHVLPVAG